MQRGDGPLTARSVTYQRDGRAVTCRRITFDVFRLVLEAVQGEDDTAHQHVGVHQGAVDLGQEGLELGDKRDREMVMLCGGPGMSRPPEGV